MKKLPAPEKAVHSTPQSEQRVEQLAAHSIVDREVVTEAMADVWEKQGNKEKAIDIYGKLSLLNPSKSSYFAAKIEHLKQSWHDDLICDIDIPGKCDPEHCGIDPKPQRWWSGR